jgi:hypothetical protein
MIGANKDVQKLIEDMLGGSIRDALAEEHANAVQEAQALAAIRAQLDSITEYFGIAVPKLEPVKTPPMPDLKDISGLMELAAQAQTARAEFKAALRAIYKELLAIHQHLGTPSRRGPCALHQP